MLFHVKTEFRREYDQVTGVDKHTTLVIRSGRYQNGKRYQSRNLNKTVTLRSGRDAGDHVLIRPMASSTAPLFAGAPNGELQEKSKE